MARTILIGDIHGCWDELQALLDRVALTDDDLVVSVGDLVDRGPAPTEVVRWFRNRARSVVVCGNHERKHVRRTFSFSQEITRLQLGEDYADAVAWMATLPYHWETDEVRVVHAALIPGVPLAETPEDVLCGTTSGTERLERRLGGARWHEQYTDPKPVVFGHHVVGAEPLVRDGRVFGIDTGACHGMALTALILPSFELVSVPARADHWRATKRIWQVPVLRERPWASMSFDQLDRKAAELARGAGADAVAFLDRVRAWSAEVRAAIPTVAAAVDEVAATLVADHGPDGFARAAAAHPAGSTVIRRHAGKLSTDHLGCSGPGDVLRLAARLGLGLGVPSAP
ncbi:MAG: metallophosphoesterase family protein [Myxococcota bacterium]